MSGRSGSSPRRVREGTLLPTTVFALLTVLSTHSLESMAQGSRAGLIDAVAVEAIGGAGARVVQLLAPYGPQSCPRFDRDIAEHLYVELARAKQVLEQYAPATQYQRRQALAALEQLIRETSRKEKDLSELQHVYAYQELATNLANYATDIIDVASVFDGLYQQALLAADVPEILREGTPAVSSSLLQIREQLRQVSEIMDKAIGARNAAEASINALVDIYKGEPRSGALNLTSGFLFLGESGARIGESEKVLGDTHGFLMNLRDYLEIKSAMLSGQRPVNIEALRRMRSSIRGSAAQVILAPFKAMAEDINRELEERSREMEAIIAEEQRVFGTARVEWLTYADADDVVSGALQSVDLAIPALRDAISRYPSLSPDLEIPRDSLPSFDPSNPISGAASRFIEELNVFASPAADRLTAQLDAFDVRSPVSPEVILPKTQYAPRETIAGEFVASPCWEPGAWVGLVPSDIGPGEASMTIGQDMPLAMRRNGFFRLLAPATVGPHSVRMYDHDGNEVVAINIQILESTAEDSGLEVSHLLNSWTIKADHAADTTADLEVVWTGTGTWPATVILETDDSTTRQTFDAPASNPLVLSDALHCGIVPPTGRLVRTSIRIVDADGNESAPFPFTYLCELQNIGNVTPAIWAVTIGEPKSGNPDAEATVTLYYSDPDGDITTLDVVTISGSFIPIHEELDISGYTSGALNFEIGCVYGTCSNGEVILRATLTDAEGNTSEPKDFSYTFQYR